MRQDEVARAASKHTFTAVTVCRSPRPFIIMSPLESAAAIPLAAVSARRESRRRRAFRYNRTLTKRRSRNLRVASPSVHTRKAPEKRKVHQNRQTQKRAPALQTGGLIGPANFDL